MHKLKLNFEADIAAITKIDSIASILEVICRTTGMGFAAVARVTESRWIACAVRDEIQFGLVPGSELKVETTLCHEIRQHQQAIVIANAAEDPTYATHHTPKLYGLQSYISLPIITKGGQFFGTLCAIDPHPTSIDRPEIINMFSLFADLIAFHLYTDEQLKLKDKQLKEERKITMLRDKFIAILGHDLRNPVGAVLNVAELLLRMPVEDRVKRMAVIIQNSTYRMKALIENILDFARGHLGEGIKLKLSADETLAELLMQVVTELRLVSPTHVIITSFDIKQPFNCDPRRIAQLLGNLLSNAIIHGKKDEAIEVDVISDADEFFLSVSNKGDKISERVMNRLFQPFYRGVLEPKQQGLGLGLYIAAEIAKAHHGKLEVHSTTEKTSFTLKIARKNVPVK